MAELTKKDLEDVLDKKLPQYQAAIIEAVDEKFRRVDERFDVVDEKFKAVAERFDVIEKKIDDMEIRFNQKLDALMTTLDNFLKRLTDPFGGEFILIPLEVAERYDFFIVFANRRHTPPLQLCKFRN